VVVVVVATMEATIIMDKVMVTLASFRRHTTVTAAATVTILMVWS
jgi:hypothetical protein